MPGKETNQIYIDIINEGGDAVRGHKTDDATREKIIAAYLAGESQTTISKEFGIGRSTVSGIIINYKKEAPDEFDEIRREKKMKYVEEASEVASGLLLLLKRRVQTLIDKEDVLDEIIDIIEDSDASEKAKSSLIIKMQTLLCPKLTELTTAFGTVYDKLERIEAAGKAESDEEESGGITISAVAPLEGDDNE
jgi:hypothetical protein